MDISKYENTEYTSKYTKKTFAFRGLEVPILEFSRQESTIGYGYLLHFVCRYSQNQLVYSQTNLPGNMMFTNTSVFDVNIYQHPQRGAKWFRYRVSIHHPLGFKLAPL